jgi:adenylosuccinate lyase
MQAIPFVKALTEQVSAASPQAARYIHFGATSQDAMSEIVRGLEVHAAAMRASIDRTDGLAFSEALALRLSRPVADRLVLQAVREGRHLPEVLRTDQDAMRGLGASDAASLFEPQASYGLGGRDDRAGAQRLGEDARKRALTSSGMVSPLSGVPGPPRWRPQTRVS